jgi:predicted acylesterase/phospholipase RssA
MGNPIQGQAPPYPRTKFFQACRGVFEGGGCRGAAHIGAFDAAIRCGVNFSEVAGTSAGSIIAALIGAGATPNFLLEKCAYLKFADLLADPKGRIATPLVARALSYVLPGRQDLVARILAKGSAYSSENLESWLDGLLAELLPKAERPVKFKDLILPTWVVATDLARRRAKIWSTQDTPGDAIAMAVRSSCSVPLFFEPVESGNSLYVDGGMLSNLPAFVFADRSDSALAPGGRILGFRLVENTRTDIERTVGGLIRRLVDTAISGATKMQNEMKSNVSLVSIPTGDVSSLNFEISKEDVDSLLESGRSAMRAFVSDEHSRLNDALASDIARFGEDELYDDLVREMATPGKRLIVSCAKTRWLWDLFPSVAHWLFSGASVDVIIQEGPHSPRERQRRRLLTSLGARVAVVDTLPVTCFALSREDDNHNALFIQNISDSQFAPTGAVYIGLPHRPVISTFLRMLEALLPGESQARPSLTLQSEDPSRVIALLKQGVDQYTPPGVTLELRNVALQDPHQPVKLVVRRIRSFKYRQIAYLRDLYERAGLPFCAPASIQADGKYVSTILPPVLESWGSELVAIEGNTRLLYLDRTGADHVSALVVRGVTAALPGTPVTPREALLASYEISVTERIKGFALGNFRSIEGAVRPPD